MPTVWGIFFFEERDENNNNVLALAILKTLLKTTQYKQLLDQLCLGRADLERRETL